jgi:hypothetical protein
MTPNGHLHEMPKKFVSWGWTLGMKMSQAYPRFSCGTLITNHTPGDCIIFICFDEWGWGICLKNAAAAAAISIN